MGYFKKRPPGKIFTRINEYKKAINGIPLTQFAPPKNKMVSKPNHLISY